MSIRLLAFRTPVHPRRTHPSTPSNLPPEPQRSLPGGLSLIRLWLMCLLVAAPTLVAGATESCRLHPITLPARLFDGVAPGTVLPNVFHGRGGFCWLSWAGSPNALTLARSLHPDPDSDTYVHPDRPDDHHLDRGDWVHASPGLAISSRVRDALGCLQGREIVVPLWDLERGNGERAAFRVVAFARIQLLDHRLHGHHRLALRFLGYADCWAAPEAPQVDAGPDQSLSEPGTVALSGTVTSHATAGPAPVVDWTCIAGPAAPQFADPHQPDTTATFVVPGAYTLRLTASIGTASAFDDVRVVLEEPNSPPIAEALALSTPEDAPLAIHLRATDPDDDPLVWRVVTAPNHGTLQGVAPDLLYVPDADFNGADAFTFRAGDGALESATTPVTITLQPVNDAPTAESQSIEATEGAAVEITLHGSDLEGSPLRCRITQVPDRGTLTPETATSLIADSTYHYTPEAGFAGEDSFGFVVSDGDLESAAAVVRIQVAHANHPPTVDAGPNRLVLPGEWLELQGTAEDDGLPSGQLTLQWSATAGPSTPEFEHTDRGSTRVRFAEPGTYELELAASDGEVRSAATTSWRVQPPPAIRPPRVDAGADQTLGWTSVAQLRGTIDNGGLPLPSGAQIQWSVARSPAPVVFESPAHPVTRATFLEAGSYILRLTVSEASWSVSDDLTVMVSPDNLAPAVDAGPDRTVILPNPHALDPDPFQPTRPPPVLSGSIQSLDHWDTAVGCPGLDGSIYENCLSGDGTNVFVAGTFDHAGGVEAIGSARWDGERFHPLFDPRPLPLPNFGTHINYATHECTGILYCTDSLSAIASRGSEVFVAGSLKELATISDGYWDMTARWSGSTWESWVFKQAGNHVRTLLATPDRVYAGGFFAFQPADASPLAYPQLPWAYSIAAWSATGGWTNLGLGILDARDTVRPETPGLLTYHAYVNALALAPDGSLFAGGQFFMDTPGGRANHIARWNGVSWEPLGSGLVGNGVNFVVMSLACGPDGSLFVGGNFTNAGGVAVRNLARWDGRQWHALGSGPANGVAGTVRALVFRDRALFAGGSFSEAAGIPAGGLARWNGVAWSALGTDANPGVQGIVRSLLPHKDGLLVGGDFTRVAGSPATNIALWRLAVPADTAFRLAGRVTDDGRPGDQPVRLHWEQLSGPGVAVIDQPDSATSEIHFPEAGSYTLRLTAGDGAATAFDTVTVTVLANQPPAVQAGPDLSLSLNEPGVLQGAVSDDALPANSTLHSLWTLESGPGIARFTDPTQPTTTVTFTAPGNYRLRLSANDGQFTAVDETLVVVGLANQPPAVHPGYAPANIRAGVPTVLDGVVTDSTRTTQPLRSAWAVLAGPGPVTFGDATTPYTTVTFWAPGSYSLQLTAADGQLSAHALLTVQVLPSTSNPPPVPPTNPPPTLTLPTHCQGQANRPLNLTALTAPTNPAGDSLRALWSAVSGPARVCFSDTATPNTTVLFPLAGFYQLRLTITDGTRSSVAEIGVTIAEAPNVAPYVDAGPDLEITQPATAALQGTVLDDGLPNGIPVTAKWSVLDGPGAVQFIPGPLSSWAEAAFSEPGTYRLQLAANDSVLTSTSTVRIVVLPGTNAAPSIDTGPDIVAVLNDLVPLPGEVRDDGLPAGVLQQQWVQINGPGAAAITQLNGQWLARFSAPGAYTLALTANDGALSTTRPLAVTVLNEIQDPIARLESPAEPVDVYAPRLITGTASSPQLQDWTLTCTPTGLPGSAPAQILLARGTRSVTSATLGDLDPTLLPNGPCQLRLRATDVTGRSSEDTCDITIQGRLKPGVLRLDFTDLTVPVAGYPLRIRRTYDSRLAALGQQGDFGIGWTLDTSAIRIQVSTPLGEAWEQHHSGAWYSLLSSKPHVVTISLPGDRSLRFLARPTTTTQFGRPMEWTTLDFTNFPGTTGTLAIDGEADAAIVGFDGPAQLVRLDVFEIFNPSRFRLQTPDGWTLRLDTATGLIDATDPHGRCLNVAPAGITHSGGVGIPFERDAAGRLTAITSPDGGRTEYCYDDGGRLSSVRTPGNQTTAFEYDAHHRLISITGPDGVRRLECEFDGGGRLVAQRDAAGHAARLEHDLPARREVVFDRLGQPTTHHYDDRGNLLRSVDALGFVTSRTYDDRDRLTSVTRFAEPAPANSGLPTAAGPHDRTARFAYDDADQLVTFTDPLGRCTHFTYGPNGAVQSVTGPLSASVTNDLDHAGQVVATRDARGIVAAHEYTSGMRTRTTNALGQTTSFTYDPAGRLLQSIDHAGRVFQVERDPAGRVVSESVTLPDGAPLVVRRLAYDASGQVTNVTAADGSATAIRRDLCGRPVEVTAPLLRRTLLAYDAAGQLVQVTSPDGQSEGRSYDAEGRLTAVTNQLGHITRIHRDALGRPHQIEFPDGTLQTTHHDAFGQVIASTDARSQTTWFGYDLAGQLTSITNAIGAVSRLVYDSAGRCVAVADPLGHTNAFEFDALGQPVRTVHADGTSDSATYDVAGRLVATTDALQQTTLYGYDFDGNLAAVTNTLGHVTRYDHDLLGRLTAITDANGHRRTFEYDLVGRLIRHSLPLGQTETFEYDPAGRLARQTDFNGFTTGFDYDPVDRLTARHPDPRLGEPAAQFTYDAIGQLRSATDPAGSTTFQYDSRGWLTSREVSIQGAPTSLAIHYERDAIGRLTRLRTSTGGTDVRYSYTALNQLATVEEGALGPIRYAYDPAGNLQCCALPNGITNYYAYDDRNRASRIQAVAAHDTVSDLLYRYDPLGRRIGASSTLSLQSQDTAIDGAYTYDAMSRLVSESYQDPQLPTLSTLSYAYDAAGNRTTSTVSSVQAGPRSTPHQYDANDQVSTFTHDPNGNPVSGLTATGEPFQDTFDSRDRLRQRVTTVDQQPTVISLLHNALGDRVRKTVSTSGSDQTTFYLVDDQNPTGLPEVLEELQRQPDGTLKLERSHTFGLTHLAELSPTPNGWRAEFSGLDALGSIRFRTSATGQITAFQDFDAFGNLTGGGAWDESSSTWRPSDSLPPSSLRRVFAWSRWDSDLGLYHQRARDYDPRLGRFTTRDPFPGDLTDPSSLHRYLYAHNDPVNRIDPTGCFDLASVSLGIAIGRTVHDMYDGSVLAAGYGLMESIEGLAQGRSDEEILLRYEVGSLVGAGVGILIGKIAQIAGRALVGELSLPSPANLTSSIRTYLDRQTLWAREVMQGVKGNRLPMTSRTPSSGLGDATTSPWLLDKRVGVVSHLEQFRAGGSFLVSEAAYARFIEGKAVIGRSDGVFVTTTHAMNQLLAETAGNVVAINHRLGTFFSGPLRRIDVVNPLLHNARMPNGMEAGANNLFRWGGYTKGGMPEVVIDPIPVQAVSIHEAF